MSDDAYMNQPYIRRLQSAQPLLQKIIGARVSDVFVQHDDDCPTQRKKPKLCRCDPDITVVTDGQSFEIDRSGNVKACADPRGKRH